jgi:hypothetical protein
LSVRKHEGWATRPISLNAAEAVLRETVKHHFDRDQTVRAEAQAHGTFNTDVYFRPGDFDEITIEHEALHNLTGKSDDDLAAQLGGVGLSNVAASSYISQALRDNRCDKPKAKKKKRR